VHLNEIHEPTLQHKTKKMRKRQRQGVEAPKRLTQNSFAHSAQNDWNCDMLLFVSQRNNLPEKLICEMTNDVRLVGSTFWTEASVRSFGDAQNKDPHGRNERGKDEEAIIAFQW